MPAGDLVTTTDLENFRNGDAGAILRQVQGAIRRYCGWHIAPTLTETITVDGSGARHLGLPSLHVTAIESVTCAGEVLEPTTYDWSQDGFLELRGGWFPDRPRSIEITWTHGHDEAPDVVGVAVGIADRMRATGGVRREQAGAVSLDFATFNGALGSIALMQTEIDLLAPYKLPPRS